MLSAYEAKASPPAALPADDQVLTRKKTPYSDYGPQPLSTGKVGEKPAVHIEVVTQYKDFYELKDSILLSTAATRHAEAAASILNHTADQKDLDVHTLLVNARSITVSNLQSADGEGLNAALNYASVITNSEFLSLTADFTEVWRTQREKDVVVAKATGNRSNLQNTNSVLQRQPLDAFTGGDAVIRVGAAEDGVVEDYSLCNGPDLVAENPFNHGFSFKYAKTRQELQTALAQRWENLKGNYYKAAADTIARQKTYITSPDSKTIEALIAEEMNFLQYSTDMQPKLEETAESIRDKEQKRILALYDTEWASEADVAVNDIAGTSFVAPAVGGYIARQRNLYTALTDIDFTAAAYLASRPERATKHQTQGRLLYRPNDRGLLFDPDCAGWGAFDPKQFADITRMMQQTLIRHPKHATHQNYIESTDLRAQVSKDTYAVNFEENAVAVRVLAQISFKQEPPPYLTITSPKGASYRISPAVAQGNTVIFSTPAFLGSDIAGSWRLTVLEGFEINAAKLAFHAVAPDSIIDQAIRSVSAKRDLKPLVSRPTEPSRPKGPAH